VFIGQAPADLLAVFGVAVVQDDVSTVFPCGRDLGRRRVLRHRDGCRDTQQPGRQRDGLRVVARREGHDAGLALVGVELRQRIEGAAELERAHALEVFALEKDARPELAVDGARAQDRRAVGMPLDARGGSRDVIESRQHGTVARAA
jgi:hypothetical protein